MSRINKYKIKEPVWKDNSIGIADFRLREALLVDVTYKNKNKERIFPDTYIINNPNLVDRDYQTIQGRKIYKFLISELDVFAEKEYNI
jgi:hypothetical protein|tara:strand:+ start:248 stop:511 length:264 start_codon:yes stop_codon:yes gene_type:complete